METGNLPYRIHPPKKESVSENGTSLTKLEFERCSKQDLFEMLKETKKQCCMVEEANQKLQQSVDKLTKALDEQNKKCQTLEDDKSFLRSNIKKASTSWFERKAKLSEGENDTSSDANVTESFNQNDNSSNKDETLFWETETSEEVSKRSDLNNTKLKERASELVISEETVKLFSELKFKDEQFQLSERRCAELNKRLKEYEKVINDQEVIIHGLEVQLDTYFNDNQTMSKQLVDLHRLFVDLEAINEKQVKTPTATQEPDTSTDHLPTTQEFKEMSGSVTKTYMKLKELIYEKKSLVTEIERLQTLNIELQNRVSQQETRLIRVSDALQTTWLLVSNLKDQHEKLRTSETILRYELREKREILHRLRSELECSREQWHIIRQKNSEAEQEWTNLREELNERQKLRKLAELNGNLTLTQEEIEGAVGYSKPVSHEFEPPIDLLVDMGIEYGVVNADDEESETVIALIEGEDVHEMRLQNLEEQCCFLYQKLMSSTSRALTLASHLSSLHQHYAMSEDEDDDDDDDNNEEYYDDDEGNLYESEMASPDSESYDTAYVSEGDGADSPSGTTENETTININETRIINGTELTEAATEDSPDADENGDFLSRRLINFLPRKIEILRAENNKLEEKLQTQLEEKCKIECTLTTTLEFERRQRRHAEERLSHLGKCVDELKLERNGKIAIIEEKLRKKVEEIEMEEREHVRLRDEYEVLKEKYEERGELLKLTSLQLQKTVYESEQKIAELLEEILNLKNKIFKNEKTTSTVRPSTSTEEDCSVSITSNIGMVPGGIYEVPSSEQNIATSMGPLPQEKMQSIPVKEMEVDSRYKHMVILTNTCLRVPFYLPLNTVLWWSFYIASEEIKFSISYEESNTKGPLQPSQSETESHGEHLDPSTATDKSRTTTETKHLMDQITIDISKDLLVPHIVKSSNFPASGKILPRIPGTYSLIFQNHIPTTQEIYLKLWTETSKNCQDSVG